MLAYRNVDKIWMRRPISIVPWCVQEGESTLLYTESYRISGVLIQDQLKTNLFPPKDLLLHSSITLRLMN